MPLPSRRTLWLGFLTFLPAILVGIFFGLGTFTFYYAEGGSYFSTNPKACVNCHIMQEHFDGWRKASHHGLAGCNDCHMPHEFIPKYIAKAENGFFHSKAFTLQDFHEPIRIKHKNIQILEANCVRCHESLVSEVIGHGRTGEDHGCIRCHASVGHGPSR